MTLQSIDQHENRNGIVVDSPGDMVGEGLVTAANTVTPGMVVTKGTNDGEVIPDNNSGKHLGYALERVSSADEDLRSDFDAGENVRYAYKPGARCMLLIASGQNLTKGARLKSSSGKLVAFVAGTDGAEEAVAVIIQENGTGGALGADAYKLCRWGVQ
jgi:hypothetical protein